jgi:arsenate reductase
MTITIFHNPRCSKSRAALALLQERGVEPIIRLYLEDPPDAAELRAILVRLGIPARGLLRTGEPEFRDQGLDDESLSEDRLIRAMCAAPRLIERPIVIAGRRAAIGRPPDAVLALL